LHASIVLFENTALTPSGSLPVFTDYASFSTGAQSGTLSKVVVVLSGDNTSSGTIDVGLYSNDIGDVPGALATSIGTIQDTGLAGTPTPFGVSLTSNPLLAAGTRYWIGLTSSTTSAICSYSIDSSGAGVANEFYSQSAGSSSPNSTGPLLMEVDMTPSAVPEPATFLFGATALASMALYRRRVRRN